MGYSKAGGRLRIAACLDGDTREVTFGLTQWADGPAPKIGDRVRLEFDPDTGAVATASYVPTFKACPFCGSTHIVSDSDDFGLWHVRCWPCGGSTGNEVDVAAATAAWNRRTP